LAALAFCNIFSPLAFCRIYWDWHFVGFWLDWHFVGFIGIGILSDWHFVGLSLFFLFLKIKFTFLFENHFLEFNIIGNFYFF